jgi:hypothetical protein
VSINPYKNFKKLPLKALDDAVEIVLSVATIYLGPWSRPGTKSNRFVHQNLVPSSYEIPSSVYGICARRMFKIEELCLGGYKNVRSSESHLTFSISPTSLTSVHKPNKRLVAGFPPRRSAFERRSLGICSGQKWH